MKKLFLIAVALLLLTATACVAQTPVTLAWDLSGSEPLGSTGGYRIYQGTAPRTYNPVPVATVGQGVSTVTFGATAGLKYWAATAIDSNGNESDFSNEVSATVKIGSGARVCC